ncbi:HPr kinase/phosphorylase [Nitrobacteraceae bacterium AZCC 1564]
MTSQTSTSIHASAVLVGDRAVLIRGPSGSGKSSLAFDLILAGRAGQSAKATLIGDDRVRLAPRDGRLIVQNVPELAGLIEIRGLGIRKIDATSEAVIGVVVDLSASDAERLPPPEALKTVISGVELPRIPVAAGQNPLSLVLAFLTTT